MTNGPELINLRRQFTLLIGAGAVFYLIVAVIPVSPGYLRPGAWGALALTLVGLVAVNRGAHLKAWFPATVAVLMATTMGVVAADADGPASNLFVLWIPWIGIYCGFLTLRSIFVTICVLSIAVLGAAWVNTDFGTSPALLVTSVVSAVVSCLFVHALQTWGRGRVYSDPLTSLANRPGLTRGADPAIARIRTRGSQALLVVLDINRFREVNDALGHDAGDELLRLIARRLGAISPPAEFIARLGSDEFALVLAGPPADGELDEATADDMLRAVGRVALRQVEGTYRVGDVDVEVEASAGMAVSPRQGDTLAALLPCADAALYRAKQQGERIGLWDAGIAAVRPWEIALYAQLRSAIPCGELVLFYQPLQSARTGRIVGVEALLRWRHPTRGLLPPGSFLPMAERSNLIVELTEWVLDEALRQSAEWAAAGLHMPVSVNLSARVLVVDRLPAMVSDGLEKHGLPADVLTLEVTESALVTQPTRAAAMMRELRTKGVKLSLDDFGTGYSSMEVLKALPFDEVKIDRTFVADARGSLPDAAIVRSVVELGHRLGLRVVGEGVEDQRIRQMMMELGCDILQGDVISQPLSASDLVDRLKAGVALKAEVAQRGSDGTDRGGATDEAGGAGAGRGRAADEASTHVGEPAEDAGAALGAHRESGLRRAPRDDQCRVDSHPAGSHPTVTWHGVAAPIGREEPARLAAVGRYELLEGTMESELGDVATLAAALTDCFWASVVIVDAEGEQFWGRRCHETRKIPGRIGLGAFVVASGELIEVTDVAADTRFAPLAKAFFWDRIRFVAAAPLTTRDGYAIGAVVVGDRIPRRLTSGQRDALASLARQAMAVLDARREALMSERITEVVKALDRLWYPDELPAAGFMVADVGRTVLHSDGAALLLPDLPGATVFHVLASSVSPGTSPMVRAGDRISAGDDSLLSILARSQDPMFVTGPTCSALLPAEMVRAHEIAAALALPLPGEGGIVGLLVARWSLPLSELDPPAARGVALLSGPAGHALARLRAARTRAREFGIDPITGLTTRSAFLSTLQGLPEGTAVCLFGVGVGRDGVGCEAVPSLPRAQEGPRGAQEWEQTLGCFAQKLRAVTSDPSYLARWAENRFVMAVPSGGRAEAETAVARLRRAWEREPMQPFVVGIAVTRGGAPASAALMDAERHLLAATDTVRAGAAESDRTIAAESDQVGASTDADGSDPDLHSPEGGRPTGPLVRSGGARRR